MFTVAHLAQHVDLAPRDRPQCEAVAGNSKIEFVWQYKIYDEELRTMLSGKLYDILIANIGSHDIFEEDLRPAWQETHTQQPPLLAELLKNVTTRLGKQARMQTPLMKWARSSASSQTLSHQLTLAVVARLLVSILCVW
jgi:hypothetical protein